MKTKRTLEQIEKELEEVQELYDKKWHSDNTNRPWEEFLKWAEPEIKKIGELSREKRMNLPVILGDKVQPDDHVMSIKDFIGCVKCGGFIDYDGFGRYVKDNQETNIEIYPSDVKHKAIRKDFDTIVWYNR
jgi:hypothetical protein